MPSDDIVPQKVTKRELYRYFNEPAFRVDLGRRTNQQVEQYCELAPPSAGQTEGTTSHVYDWFEYDQKTEQAKLLATVHLYKKPDGTLGASGQPDPIWLRVGSRLLFDP